MANPTYPRFETDVPYSDNSPLNTFDVCIPSATPPPSSFWVVFIHGGAWRDPQITSTSFEQTQAHLLQSPISPQIAGLASLNYRLSPYPSHPTDPSTPYDPSRSATHPDHINDVLSALLFLQEKYGFDDRYVLAGHSCGATLALQVAMRRYWGAQYEATLALELNVVPPMAIVGLEGLYHLPDFVETNKMHSGVREFMEGAFGPDVRLWAEASPALWDAFDESWDDGRLVLLGHSKEDELVGWEQCELMEQGLRTQNFSDSSGDRKLDVLLLKGIHDEVWQDGKEAARAIQVALEHVLKAI